MTALTELSFSWVPGTMDRVRFTIEHRTYTVYLRDVKRQTVHSDSALYLKGRVVLPVTSKHLGELMGRLSLGHIATP
ncbi:hypothetical protein LAJ19_12885 [Deinococcus taeanensis]|uniref:hypothetical protein n=1 Tax=Deinococcus taeanensis TaxID=2737050 RepID=UPI001CDC80DA|nr:hypothetical protein [Deinococcus taeanensis]UBV42505.1 hypothetical protein LAJ19_12885 [Deinococcus taeanensis]